MKSHRGFTIIEVSLFLAVSAFIFVGIAAGTSLNVSRQRYNSAVQDYTEFLRRLYSSVEDVENEHEARGNRSQCTISSKSITTNVTDSGNGRSNCAIYGKIAIFGETNAGSKIMVYDIIGDVIDHTNHLSATNTLSALAEVGANYVAREGANYVAAGNSTSYSPDWDAKIETVSSSNSLYRGAVMIVRSPLDGTIGTYVLDLNNSGRQFPELSSFNSNYSLANFLDASRSPHFASVAVNFCVASDDLFAVNGRRRNVRILENGSNSSAIELVEADSEEDNVCQ